MNAEIQNAARLLLTNPGYIFVTPDGLRAYALVYGKMSVITGAQFNTLTSSQTLAFIDTQIKLYYLGKSKAVRKVT